MSSQSSLKQWSNKTPVIRQGSRIRCNTCRALQSRRPSSAEKLTVISHYVEPRSHPQIIQGCVSPPIQTEGESSSTWQSSGHLFIVSCWEALWTDLTNTLNSQGSCQKANVDSGRTVEQWTWSSQQGSFKRNARNRMWTSIWHLWPYQSI